MRLFGACDFIFAIIAQMFYRDHLNLPRFLQFKTFTSYVLLSENQGELIADTATLHFQITFEYLIAYYNVKTMSIT